MSSKKPISTPPNTMVSPLVLVSTDSSPSDTVSKTSDTSPMVTLDLRKVFSKEVYMIEGIRTKKYKRLREFYVTDF